MENDLRNKPYDVLVHKLYYWSHKAKVPKHHELNIKKIKPTRDVIRTEFDLQMYMCVDSKGVIYSMSNALNARCKNYGYEMKLGISSIETAPWLFNTQTLMDMIRQTAKHRHSTSAVLKSKASERWYIAVSQPLPIMGGGPQQAQELIAPWRSDKYIISWVDIEAYSKLLHDSGFFTSHDQELGRLKLV